MKLSYTLILILLVLFVSYSSQEPEANTFNTDELLKRSVYFSYFAGNGFIHSISSNSGPTKGLIEKIETFINEPNDEIRLSAIFSLLCEAAWTFLGFVVLTIFGLFFVIFLPIFGLVFFCCRCCGNCGGELNVIDERKDPCKRAALVVAFINNYLLTVAITEDEVAFNPLSKGLLNMNESLYTTINKLKDPSISGNLDEQKAAFDTVLGHFKKDFITQSGARKFIDPIESFIKLSQSYQKTSSKHEELTNFLNSFEKLDQTLEDIRKNIYEKIDSNLSKKESQGVELWEKINNSLVVRASAKPLQTKEIKLLLDRITQDQDSIDKLNQFNKSWEKVDIGQQIKNDLDDAWNQLSNDTKNRESLAQSFEFLLKFVSRAIHETITFLKGNTPEGRTFDQIRQYIKLYGYYIGCGLLCLPVSIAICLYFGVCFGICGRRPQQYAGCCNKNIGAIFLMAAVKIIFIIAPILMLACTILFWNFGVLEATYCGPLGEPSCGTTDTVDVFYQIAAKNMIQNVDPRLKWIKDLKPFQSMWIRCKNESMINSFEAGMLELPIDDDLKKILEDLTDKISINNNIRDIIVDSIDSTKKTFDSLEGTYKEFKFDQSINALALPVTNITEWEILFGDMIVFRQDLLNSEINELKKKVVEPLDNKRLDIVRNINELMILPQLWRNITENLENFQKDLDKILESSIKTAISRLKGKLLQQLRLAVMSMWQPIDCKNIYKSSHETSDAFCKNILQPINGFWYGLGFCVILYIPILFFSILLVSLYRKSVEYYSDTSETNYVNYKGFYMEDVYNTNDSKKKSKRNSKNTSPKRGLQEHGVVISQQQGYQPVSVFAYDAYE